jgi:hypothetical protein
MSTKPNSLIQEKSEILFYKAEPTQHKNSSISKSAILPVDVQLYKSEARIQVERKMYDDDDDEYAANYIKIAFKKSILNRFGSACYNESYVLRIILGVVFLACTVYCVYSILMVTINYFHFSVLTVSSIKYEIPAEFPGKPKHCKK